MNKSIYEYALDNAIASVEIEGYNVTQNQREFCLDFLNGKMDKDNFIKVILEGCRV